MGAAVVGRLYKRGRKDRTTASVGHPRCCCRNHSAAGEEAWRRAGPPDQSGNSGAAIHDEVLGFRGTIPRRAVFPDIESVHTETLPPNLDLAPFTCFWEIPSLRYRNHRPATLRAAEDGKWPQLGICQPLSQFNVEGFRDGKDVGFPLRGQSRARCFTPRKTAGSRKTSAPAESNSAPADIAQGTGSHPGSVGRTDRDADRRDFGTAPKGREFCYRPASDRAGLLSRLARLTQNQRQPPYASVAHSTRRCADSNLRARSTGGGGRSGISDSQRHAIERHQPVAPSFETGRLENWYAVAELAHPRTHPRYASAVEWGLSEGRADATRPQQDVHNLGDGYRAHPSSSTASGGKPRAIGDEW